MASKGARYDACDGRRDVQCCHDQVENLHWVKSRVGGRYRKCNSDGFVDQDMEMMFQERPGELRTNSDSEHIHEVRHLNDRS